MKKLALATLFAVLVSCNSDRSENETNLLIGVWKIKSEVTISGKDNTTVLNEYLPDDCKKKGTYEFKSDGKYIANSFNNTANGCEASNYTTTYSYVKSENKITIGGEDAKVLQLTQNVLVVQVNDDYDYNNDGTKDHLKYTFIK